MDQMVLNGYDHVKLTSGVTTFALSTLHRIRTSCAGGTPAQDQGLYFVCNFW